jgi:hypothetical protein
MTDREVADLRRFLEARGVIVEGFGGCGRALIRAAVLAVEVVG